MPDRQPNIILINCDDLGYGDLGCYGSKVNKTPTLDKLAAEGLRFTDFYMASPVCSPSRGAMMTGCYPPRIGFDSFEGRWVLFPGQPVGLNPNEITVAQILKDAGYSTKIVGKWHCGDQPEFLPTNFGFDSYYGIPYSNDMGRQGKDDKNPPLPLLRDKDVIQEQPDQAALTERYVEESIRFIRDNKDKPFFLYMAHMYVHLPIYAPEKFMKQSDNGRYGAGVEMVDWSTSVLMDELKQLGLDDNTLVIFTSDNGSRVGGGGGSNDPLRGTKGTTWEGGQRVPCIMRWPDKIPASTEFNGLTSSMDFYATLTKIAGGTIPADRTIDSMDISEIMLSGGQGESPRKVFYYYMLSSLEAIRDKKWKLHVFKGKEAMAELYDLENDPGETTNVIDEHPDVVERLNAKMDEAREDLGDSLTETEGQGRRPIGAVKEGKPLTEYDPNHPYIIAEYDLKDRG
jgi:arylsulfatase A